MRMGTSVYIERLVPLEKRLRTIDFVARPAREFVRDWNEELLHEIQDNWPYEGETRDSFEVDIDSSHLLPRWGMVFSDNPVVRWLEYGTGELSDDPESAHQAYFPPPDRLRDWSEKRGLDPYLVARGIFNRGGTPPKRLVRDANERMNARLGSRIGSLGRMIEREAESYHDAF